ncbi:MAG: HD domain-containing protein, partial [Rhodocyclaceae bacterium]|nr:HD domain-containing protein [Rhodocyclaceae bacterium]
KPYWEVFPRGSGPLSGCKNAIMGLCNNTEEEVSVGERQFFSTSYAVRDDQGKLLYSLHILKNISEQLQAETALRESKDQLSAILNNAPTVVYLKDLEGRYLFVNHLFEQLFHVTDKALRGKRDHDIFPAGLADAFHENDLKVLAAGQSIEFEEIAPQDDGHHTYISLKFPLCYLSGEAYATCGISTDITERKKAEAHLVRLNRMYRTISHCNQTLVRANDELELCRAMCQCLMEYGGYHGVCVMYATTSAAQAIPMGWAGFSDEEARFLVEVAHRKAEEIDSEYGVTNQPVVKHDLSQEDPVFAEVGTRLGLASVAVLPLKMKNILLGVLWIGSETVAEFDEETLQLLMEIAGDLAFGIDNLRARAERLNILEKLEHSLDHAVTAIAATVEMRDPYTAGHQRRVAKLAAAIAVEMGLPPDQIEGLRMAGVVHDIGKIHVPAEILANPSKLTQAEFEIIKTHPQAGYEILKGIDFPWPVADIVRQHHEKLDGSGYPNGLSGESILLEARILTVADVVEAMASHRPYRPGFGIFPSLQEISRNKGKIYDHRVTEACLRLFLEKNYEI